MAANLLFLDQTVYRHGNGSKNCTEVFMPFEAVDFAWKSIVCAFADFVYQPENG